MSEKVTVEAMTVRTLGECEVASPIADYIQQRQEYRHLDAETDNILFYDSLSSNLWYDEQGVPTRQRPTFELAGPRANIFFNPEDVTAGIVTCGGLCPGLNDVIRGLVMVLWHRYGVRNILGFRYGYAGLNPEIGHEVMNLNPKLVANIHEDGGTILGTSRGPQDTATMVSYLRELEVDMLFAIGGDGTQRGALDLSREAEKRGAKLSVIGIPKTIDNDIKYVEQSFGFQTAFTEAYDAVNAAHNEALAARNGIGLVRLMGRHSGFIAAYAAIACNHVNFVLIPEIDFPLEGENGLLAHLEARLQRRGHAVIVVAEGAGQQYCQVEGTDKSGNKKLGDIGVVLQKRITDHMSRQGKEVNIKYIDPSYLIRGIPATPHDSVYCFRLAGHAVHAAMAGRTEMLVGKWHGTFVHLPIPLAVEKRQCVDPNGDLWMSVIEATGQPRWCE